MKIIAFLAAASLLITNITFASEYVVTEVLITKLATGGGIGLANSAPFLAQENAEKAVTDECTQMGGVLKKNTLSISEPECEDTVVYPGGIKGRNCSASAEAICLKIENNI